MSDTLETIIVDDPYKEMGITPEELQDKTEVDTGKVDEEVVGTEDFSLDVFLKLLERTVCSLELLVMMYTESILEVILDSLVISLTELVDS